MKKYKKILIKNTGNIPYKDLKEFIVLYNEREERKGGCFTCPSTLNLDFKSRLWRILVEAVIRPEEYLKEIKKKFTELKNKILNSKELSLTEMCYIFEEEFKNYKIKFKGLNDLNDSIYVDSGGTTPSTMDIYIYCFYNTLEIQNSKREYDIFVNQILQILGHEIIHREQMMNVKEKDLRKLIFSSGIKGSLEDINRKRQYISKKYEIMSYAWQIVEYMRLTGEKDKEIRKILQSSNERKFSYCPVLLWYHNLFEKNNPILKKLYKYMYEYLN